MGGLHLERLPKSVELIKGADGMAKLRYIDERLLPGELRLEETGDWRAVIEAVKSLAIRGAPAIGLAGAASFALWAARGNPALDAPDVAAEITAARPTAVNLAWGVERALACFQDAPPEGPGRLLALVKAMEAEDEAANRAIGSNGARLLPASARILTHCNAGSLATCFYGTALGVVYAAAEQGKVERVYADETRPVGQGARLTAWELARVGVPVTLICDDMAASAMAQGMVDAVVVGADRISANGDVANKIGTYGLAVLARAHGIPFYVAAPSSTIDRSLADGSLIPIEQRPPAEVLPSPIGGVDVWNPAFDVTPARYVTKVITESGVYDPTCL